MKFYSQLKNFLKYKFRLKFRGIEFFNKHKIIIILIITILLNSQLYYIFNKAFFYWFVNIKKKTWKCLEKRF